MAKRRTAAQKRATAKMIAANRARRRGRRTTTAPKRRRRRNPATSYGQRRTYARTATMNPRRRRRRAAAPARRRASRRRVRRNPTMSIRSIMRDLLKPAAVGAVGAIVNDAAFTYLPIPAQFKAPGMMRYASKGISAILMTWVAGYVVKRDTAAQLGIGALTQLSAEIARNFLAANVPQLAPVAMEGMGLYVPSGPMGYYNPAPTAGGGVGLYVPGSNASSRLPNLANTQPGEASSMSGVSPDGHHYY